ncbi:MAG: type III pantothenate kinase [Saprospiraceae bacterium]|jgi:type III pantothenate kinase|nr:type III pantothenate kinase [Saprospiraceae bacterium]MBP9193942.1 type III pantothenate kinase [Saprospiraceae bacterium]
MQLVVDIGNSNIVIALRVGDEWPCIFRYETKEDQPGLYYQNGLMSLLFEWGIHSGQLKSVTISSVVPHMNPKIVEAVQNATGIQPLLLGPGQLKQLDLKVPHANEIGTDLVANAYAAIKIWHKPSIIADFGTALTFTVAHPNDGILGVTIVPGIKTAFGSLSDHTAQLPQVNLSRPTSAIGQNTTHAIQAGILIGYEGLVSHLLTKIQDELPETYLTIATGGLSEALENITANFDHIDKNLTIEGIVRMRDWLDKDRI